MFLGFGIRGLFKVGKFDANLISPGFGNSDGKAKISHPGVAADIFVRSSGIPLFLMLNFGFLPSVDDKTAEANLHPRHASRAPRSTYPGSTYPRSGYPGSEPRKPYSDSFIELEENYYMGVLLGLPMYRSQGLTLEALGGVRATRTTLALHTDESGGGGRAEKFTRKEFRVGPVIGMQGRYRIGKTNSVYGGCDSDTHEWQQC